MRLPYPFQFRVVAEQKGNEVGRLLYIVLAILNPAELNLHPRPFLDMAYFMLKGDVNLPTNYVYKATAESLFQFIVFVTYITIGSTDATKYYFSNRIVHIWNSLTNNIVSVRPTVSSFKRRLLKFELSI